MKTRLLKKYPVYVALYVVSMLLSLAVPFLLGYLIDDIIMARNFKNIFPWFGVTFSVTVLSNALSFYFMDYATAKAGIVNSKILSIDCAKKILRMPLPLYEKKEKSYYYNVITNSSFTYGDMHAQIYLELVSCVLSILLILGITFVVNAYLGIVFLIFIPVVIAGSQLKGKKLARIQKDALTKQDSFLGSLQDIINSKREINVLKQNGYFERSFSDKMSIWTKFILRYRFNEYLMEKLPGMLANVYSILFLLVGVIFIEKGRLTPGVLIMEYQYLSMISGPISQVSQIMVRKKANTEHIERVDSFEKTDVDNVEHKKYETEENSLFSAESLTFYNTSERKTALFSSDKIRVPDKGLFIIKGQNGTGKSMLLNFIYGNTDIRLGTGQFGFAHDITDRTAFLTYPLFFMDGNFSDNMFGKKYDEKLLEILNIDFTDKEITTNPLNLSYGQQQKIGLLRVLSMESDFLFLDEPLSNLDAETQSSLAEYIRQIKSEKAVIAIMHDETFDAFADKIFIIRDQRLAEVMGESEKPVAVREK